MVYHALSLYCCQAALSFHIAVPLHMRLRTLMLGPFALQLTDQKMAMESLLVDLGVTAKTNFIKIKGLFDEMDTDGSGDISTDELTRVPRACVYPPTVSLSHTVPSALRLLVGDLHRIGRQLSRPLPYVASEPSPWRVRTTAVPAILRDGALLHGCAWLCTGTLVRLQHPVCACSHCESIHSTHSTAPIAQQP